MLTKEDKRFWWRMFVMFIAFIGMLWMGTIGLFMDTIGKFICLIGMIILLSFVFSTDKKL